MVDPLALIGAQVSSFTDVKRGLKYKSTRQILETTIKDLDPVVEEIGQLVRANGHQSGEVVVEEMKNLIKASQEILDKNKIHWWNFCLAPCFQSETDKGLKSIQRYCLIQMQARILNNSEKMISLLISIANNSQSTSSQTTQSFMVNTVEFQEFTVGLDGSFMKKLRSELIHGHEQVLNLYGLPGSGRTTLAKKLCDDSQVKGHFESIIFVVLGSQSKGREASQNLQDVELMVNPVLLVLDDVWPESEKIVDEFRVKMRKGSKIFVTSRGQIATPGYEMEKLSENDAVDLFLHFFKPISNDHFDDFEIKRIVKEIVNCCKRLPLALEFLGRELRNKGIEKLRQVHGDWSLRGSFKDWNSELLARLQKSLDLVNNSIRECFMDLGLFPEDQNIPVSALIDICTEVNDLDE